MNVNKKTLMLSALLLAHSTASFAGEPHTNNMFGTWTAVTFQGDLKSVSPNLEKVKWEIMNQTRTRDDSAKGLRFTENVLFSQIGYQVTSNASFWGGYVRNWIDPLNKPSFKESRPYQDFLWKQTLGSDLQLMLRTRVEQRINEKSGNVGVRPRQLIQFSHPIPFVNGLSAYLGDEVLFYANKNSFGKRGFSENRIFTGLSYQFTNKIGADLGYMGQYVDDKTDMNLFTHNLQSNIRFKF